MSAPETCRHQHIITEVVDQSQPMLDAALRGLNQMIESAADMNRTYQGAAMFDRKTQEELDHINDVTARSMTHRADIEEQVEAISSEACLDGGVACKETCQKIGAITRLTELLSNSPLA